jgi:hypothetical protein
MCIGSILGEGVIPNILGQEIGGRSRGIYFSGGPGGGAPQPSCNPTIDMYAFSALFFEKGEKQPLGTDKNTS